MSFSFPCHPYHSLFLSMPSSLPAYKPLLSIRLSFLVFSICFSPCFLLHHTNKRAGMVKSLKLNNLCPAALNTQTGCSQNILKKKKDLKHQRKAEGRAWQNNRSDLVCVTAQRLLQWAYTQARRCEKSCLGGAGLHHFLLAIQEVFTVLQRSLRASTSTCSTHTANKSIYTILCQHRVPIPSADKKPILKKKEPARPCYPAWLALLAVCHSAAGGGTRCCIVPPLGVDSTHW